MNAEQLQAIKERFMNTPDGYNISQGVKLIEQMEFDGIKLIVEVERLQKALEFYANENNHRRLLGYINGEGEPFYNESQIMRDKGEIARTALRGE